MKVIEEPIVPLTRKRDIFHHLSQLLFRLWLYKPMSFFIQWGYIKTILLESWVKNFAVLFI